ncbi:MAG: dihydrofolate reductase family protein [Leifsonia sp.]
MGRFVYTMNTSLDLLIEQVPGDHGAGWWLRIDEELHQDFNDEAKRFAMFVQGRVFYEIMEKAWPDAAEDASAPGVTQEYGRIWVSTPKVLVSRTRTSADYDTRIIGGGDTIGQLAQLKAETDGRIAVGGAALASQLLRADLLDELLLYTHPSIIGFGRPLFDDDDRPIDLHLLEQKRFTSGVTMHR